MQSKKTPLHSPTSRRPQVAYVSRGLRHSTREGNSNSGLAFLTAPTLVDLLRLRAAELGNKQAFRLVQDRGMEDLSVTYSALNRRAMAIGGHLQTLTSPGERALLLFPPGLAFVEAFYGCLYAGLVAIPAAIPHRHRSFSTVNAIAEASKPSLILSTAEYCKTAQQLDAGMLAQVDRPWIATDKVPEECCDCWRNPQVEESHTALLQYTSGSTSTPRGVMLNHRNLLSNAAAIRWAFGNGPHDKGVSWLPPHHDMGLIGGIVQPVYCGATCTLMAPVLFLQRPRLWLETISKVRATVSGGPNFAYDLCVRKIPVAERRDLDLSSWQVAFTGAERVRAETLERFCEAFSDCGFRREAFLPCYGLAEATLMVSGGSRQEPPVVVHFDAAALQRHEARPLQAGDLASRALVGCGACQPEHSIAIVDPQSRLRCAPGRIGEIWVKGTSVASGYFEQPKASDEVFGGRLGDTGEGPFLRTGDLGFLSGGQLFVTGRLKDVIIVRGRNYYAEDIENSLEGVHEAFRAGHCAAFSIETDDGDSVVVVQEIEPRQRDLNADAAMEAVRRAVAAAHELEVGAILLAKAGAIPRTTSGKVRRSACRDCYLKGQLALVAQWTACPRGTDERLGGAPVRPCRRVSAEEIESWLTRWIAARSGLPPAQIRAATPFADFGLGSLDAVQIAAELEQRLDRRLSPLTVYNYPNIAALARWLASPPSDGDAAVYETRLAFGSPQPTQPLADVARETDEVG